ncbi:hypothetical protein BYT27DRAFT_7173641 [Phlegmacium glaucopus]|nr:hypothetical protein BYT27DRAFT_7173641 [Phlegmacium glaucopus]
MPSKLHQLYFLKSLGNCDRPYDYPLERQINREILLDVSPDREALLMGNKTIEQIRQTLKLRNASSDGHWLYRTQTRRQVKLTETTTRLSVVERMGPDVADENTDNESNLHVIRRVSSASALHQPRNPPMNSIANTLDPVRPLVDAVDLWTTPLSTKDKLISPRPLEATHILLLYADVRRHEHKSSLIYPEVVELPINDLLFVLNVPNLDHESCHGFKPRRLHKEMPRILMHVPHLQTFPELVVYLHTKNQPALFRKLIPEWMRDLMHPLPHMPSPSVSSTPIVGNVATPRPVSAFHPRRLLAMLIRACGSISSSNKPQRSISTIAADISQTASEVPDEEAILHTAILLNALRDNLCHIGYFDKDLWHELDLSREILRRAISHQAKVVQDSERSRFVFPRLSFRRFF